MGSEVKLVQSNGDPLVPHKPAPMDMETAWAALITKVAADPTVDLGRTRELLALRDKPAFSAAMSACQADMRRVAADASNPQTRSRYASLAAVDAALRPIYTRHGLRISFGTAEGAAPDYVRVTCRVSLGSYDEDYHIDMPADGKGAKGGDVMTKTHATGSAVTYGRRYLLLMIFNIAVGDDDGNAAGGRRPAKEGKLSPDQVAELRTLMTNRGVPVTPFLQWAKVDKIEDIDADLFGSCVNAVYSYRGRRQ